MKILIIRFSSIGDIVLTSPVVRCIEEQLPHAEIHYLTKEQFGQLILPNPHIRKVFLLKDDFHATMKELKAENYDLIVDLHKNLRTFRVKMALGKKSISFNKLNIEKWLLTNFKINLLPKKHLVDRYFEGLKSLGIKNDGKGLDFFLPDEDFSSIEVYQKEKYVAIVTGAKFFSKRLPLVKLEELCEKIQSKIVVLGGKEDEKTGEALELKFPEKVINFCGKLSLGGSAFILKNSSKVYTNDTGLMHIAAAFKKPMVSFWGSSVLAFGFAPYFGEREGEGEEKAENLIIENNNLSCRPCSKIGYNKCPKGHFKCMLDLEVTL